MSSLFQLTNSLLLRDSISPLALLRPDFIISLMGLRIEHIFKETSVIL